jgi:anti-sigma regulatory factor (Ser/Thr protein kinase)
MNLPMLVGDHLAVPIGAGHERGQCILRHEVLRVSPGRVATARKIARKAVAEHPSCDVAELLVSELVSNAVRHSGSQFVTLVIATLGDGELRISVTDQGRGGLPRLAGGGPDDEQGRGVRMVDRLAKRWGINREGPAGMTVWFELDEHPADVWADAMMTGADW